MASWDQLPKEILISVLQHLPLKSLCRFLAVSKPWCKHIRGLDQISCAQKWYVILHPNHSYSLFTTSLSSPPRFDHLAGFLGLAYQPAVVSSDGRLICFLGTFDVVSVLNPVTHCCIQLPAPVCKDSCWFFGAQAYVTGHEDVRHLSFLVVRVYSDTSFFMELYDSREGEWQASRKLAMERDEYFVPYSGVLQESVFYFQTFDTEGRRRIRVVTVLDKDDAGENVLVSWMDSDLPTSQVKTHGIDVSYHTFHRAKLLYTLRSQDSYSKLGVWKGKLVLVDMVMIQRVVHLSVFLLERGQWLKIYGISVSGKLGSNNPRMRISIHQDELSVYARGIWNFSVNLSTGASFHGTLSNHQMVLFQPSLMSLYE